MLHNPSTLYSAGDVKLDSSPYLRIAMAQKARQQALDESANQYFTKLPEKLNTAGVRSQDILDPNGNGGIQKDIEDWQTKWALNKDAIKKGGMAQQEFMSDFSRIRQKIEESKNRAKKELTIGKEALKPSGWKPRTSDHPIIDSWSKSIYDPASKKGDGVSEYELNDLSLAAAPYTPDYEMKHDKVITSHIQPDKLPEDKGVFDPVAKKVTYTYGYTPEKINQIVKNGVASLASDRTLYNHYEDLLDKPEMVEAASKALQAEYDKKNKDGVKVIVDTPEEMYAGLKTLEFANAKIPKTFTDKKSIDEYNASEWNRRNAITNKQRMDAANKREAGKDKRLALMQQYEIPDLYGDLLEAPTTKVKMKDPTFNVDVDEELVDVTNIGADAENDLFGKEVNYQRDYKPLEIGNKKFLKKKGGVLVDENDKPLDPDAVFAKTFTRLKPSREAVAKQKAAKGTGAAQQPKAAAPTKGTSGVNWKKN